MQVKRVEGKGLFSIFMSVEGDLVARKHWSTQHVRNAVVLILQEDKYYCNSKQ